MLKKIKGKLLWLKKSYMFSVYKKLKSKSKRKLNKIKKYATLKIIFPLVYKIYARRPVDDKKVVFVEIRKNALSDSFFLLYYAIATTKQFTMNIHFLKTGTLPWKSTFFRTINLIKDMATAKYIFLNEGFGVTSSVPIRKETIITQTWHACGAFKKFGMSTGDLIFGDSRDEILKYPYYENLNHVTVSCKDIVWAYEEAMNVPSEREIVKPLGISRTDIFYDPAFIERSYQKLHAEIPLSVGKKVILYAPTFRGRIASAKTSHMLNVEMFFDAFGEDYILIFKHHPYAKNLPKIEGKYCDFAYDVTNKMEIDTLIAVADICISDYSTVIFEFSLFERPMVFFSYDLDEYYDWRGFYYNYEELTPGPVYKTNLELINYIKNIDTMFDKQKVIDFRQKFMAACDGKATQRIMETVFSEYFSVYRRDILLPEFAFQKISDGAKSVKISKEIKKLQNVQQKIIAYLNEEIAKENHTCANRPLLHVVLVSNTASLNYALSAINVQLEGASDCIVDVICNIDKQMDQTQLMPLISADYIITKDQSILLDQLEFSDRTQFVQLWNKSLPLDVFGYRKLGDVTAAQRKNVIMHKNYTLVPVSAPRLIPIFQTAFQLQDTQAVQPIGTPQTDCFFDEVKKAEWRERLYEHIPEAKEKKIIAYAPHFRYDKEQPKKSVLLPLQILSEYLNEDYIILIHHDTKDRKKLSGIPKNYNSNVQNANKFLSIYELLSIADIIVGDYRQGVYESVVADKPIFLYIPDKQDVFLGKDINFAYDEIQPGIEVADVYDLIEKIQTIDDYDYTQLRTVRNEFFKNCDGASAKRLVDTITQRIGNIKDLEHTQ